MQKGGIIPAIQHPVYVTRGRPPYTLKQLSKCTKKIPDRETPILEDPSLSSSCWAVDQCERDRARMSVLPFAVQRKTRLVVFSWRSQGKEAAISYSVENADARAIST